MLSVYERSSGVIAGVVVRDSGLPSTAGSICSLLAQAQYLDRAESVRDLSVGAIEATAVVAVADAPGVLGTTRVNARVRGGG